jgi:two-component system CheB/CheR fusion protein
MHSDEPVDDRREPEVPFGAQGGAPEDQANPLQGGEDAAPQAPEMPAGGERPAALAEAPQRPEFPVVGIGASAGGLAAIKAFLSGLPCDTDCGMAFVIVQHLDPQHKSILVDLVQSCTTMAAQQAEDGIEVQPNCVYVIPPNRDLALLGGRLHLLEPASPHGVRLPIDFFFRSLAQDQGARAICIVLSGAGMDGTLGLKAVKEAGGMVMAQSPGSAGYDGMPRSAIATGLVDYNLPPEMMWQALAAYVQHAFGNRPGLADHPMSAPPAVLEQVLLLLRAHTGHDFSSYKRTTIQRRVERRMAVAQVDDLHEYVRYLQQSPPELEALRRELLIGVTSFFRDPGAWDALRNLVFPGLFAAGPREKLRMWVPACSTGEEAYSLAILLREYLDAAGLSCEIQIFATDVYAQAVEKARSGVFAANIAADVVPERLARFFSQEDGSYRVRKPIRDMVTFAPQDVLKDPPFSKIDLITCRNWLIYLSVEAQKTVLQTFRYALRPDGYLFLGASETIGQLADFYAAVDAKWKIYRCRGAGIFPFGWAGQAPLPAGNAMADPARPAGPARQASMRELTERALLDTYVPATVLIDDSFQVLYLHGRTGKYLEPSVGEPSLNLLRMAREGLRTELPAVVSQAQNQHKTVRLDGLRVKSNGDAAVVNLIAQPVHAPGAGGNLLAIIFEDVTPAAGLAEESTGQNSDDQDARVAALQQALHAQEEHTQTVVEELQSANEELQSTNEELSTSREEMQSVNEELTTVNTELQSNVEQLARANSDISNLLASTNIATLFVDHQLRIQRFTPATSRVISLIQTDVGRPVSDIASRLLGYDRLAADVQEVLATLLTKETVVRHQDGAWYQMRIQPYRTIDNFIEGAVLTFVDVTTQKRLQLALQESQDRLALLFEALPVGVSVLDAGGKVVFANPALEKILGFTREEMLRGDHLRRPYLKPDGTAVPGGDLASVRATVEQRSIDHVETGVVRRDGRLVWTDMSFVPVALPDWKLIVVTFDLSSMRGAGEGAGRARPEVGDEGGIG